MAKNKNTDELDALEAKSHIMTYGSDGTLAKEDEQTSDIISQTILATKKKLGTKISGTPINYFNELNISDAFNEMRENAGEKKKKSEDDKNNAANFKRYMTTSGTDAAGLLMSEQGRLINFQNYKTIYEHISECAQALDVYKDNIMSPDDFTKMIFDVKYESDVNENAKEIIEDRLKDIIAKYDIERKADEIISDTLMYGENYVAVLSLENELSGMLDGDGFTNPGSFLNESMDAPVNVKILNESVQLNEETDQAFRELFADSLNEDQTITEDQIREYVANTVNNNIEIGSVKEFLMERAEADYDAHKNDPLKDIPGALSRGLKKSKKKDNKPLFINGSAVRILDPNRTVELKVDNVCYGYYYVEDQFNQIAQSSYVGPSSGREARMGTSVNIGLNNNMPQTTQFTPATSAASILNVGESKLRLITNVFINQIATKIDKNFIRKNKQFKEFIYELVKQNYIINRGIKMTYFSPDEVIKFEAPSVYRKITFAAKLYLSVMTNDILVKLGRAHDKRVFYVNVGLDANYEQAINKVIDDIKRREYKMDNVNDFNSILNLNPGRWDDYFIPTMNGDRPLEIETLAGMDTDLNSDFLQYLKNSMMTGIGVPVNLIDNMNDISFARTLSAQNANFVRSVIRYQKLLTRPFCKLIQNLYKNEFRYNNDKEDASLAMIDLEAIKVHFPSPASLNMTNINEQLQSADQNADFISTQIIPPQSDGSTEDRRLKLKAEIVKDLLPGIDWKKYEKIADNLKLDEVRDSAANPVVDQGEGGDDPYAAQMQ